jgi:predicted dehydrogenase
MTKKIMERHPKLGYLPANDRYLSKKESPKYNFNVIGTGIIGQEHIRVTELEGRGTIRGIYDPNPGSVEAAKGIMEELGKPLMVFDSMEEAYSDPEADAILICTPNYTHLEVLREVVKSGKPILLEKPMATTVEDAAEILRISEEYKSFIQVGLQYRYKSIYLEASHEVRERKSLGDVKTISISEHRIPFLDKVGQWNKFSEESGGSLVEKCCHYFDLFNLYADSRPVRVFASGSQAVNFKNMERNGQPSDILDNAFVIVEYENGIKANFSLNMFSPFFYEEIILCGDEGRLSAYERKDYQSAAGLECSLEVVKGENYPTRKISPHYMQFIEDSGHSGATYFEHQKFINNLQGQKTETATAEEGFWAVVVGAAAEESVKRSTPVIIADYLNELEIL